MPFGRDTILKRNRITTMRKIHNTLAQFKKIGHSVLSGALNAGQPALIDINEDSLDEGLKGMQTCLAKVIGPIAIIVFQDALDQWEQQPSAEPDDYELLKKMMLNEIEDQEHKERLEELLTDYIENEL
jgi:hypothetical protein